MAKLNIAVIGAGLSGQLHCGWTLPSTAPTGIRARRL